GPVTVRTASSLRRWGGADGGARRRVRAVPGTAPPARPYVLPGDAPAAGLEAASRARPVRVHPVRRRDRGRSCRYSRRQGAAAGTMMLPILGARDLVAAREPARQLGLAFQLTNFIRDVGEDLTRGRIYLPGEDLARFGVVGDDLAAGAVPRRVRELIAYEVG